MTFFRCFLLFSSLMLIETLNSGLCKLSCIAVWKSPAFSVYLQAQWMRGFRSYMQFSEREKNKTRRYLLPVNGTTGESMSLSVAERKILADEWCGKARGK